MASSNINIQIQSLGMKGFLCQANPHSLCSSLGSFSFCPNCNYPMVPSQRFKPCMKVSQAWSLAQRRKDNGLAVGCANWGLESELERELEAEMKQQEGEGEKERNGMARFRHKCGERKGVVELLECLEREAIMGEDVGKEPGDYNRRAQIFDRSSRVFQALKELNSDVPSQQSSK